MKALAVVASVVTLLCSHAALAAQDLLDPNRPQPAISLTIANEGQGCAGLGSNAYTPNGMLLTCQSGQYVRSSNFAPVSAAASGSCTTYGKGAFAFDSAGKLYVCK